MISFSVLLTLITSLLVLYLDVFINLKKEIDDIKIKPSLSPEDKKRIRNRKNILIILSFIIIICLLISVVLYRLPPNFFISSVTLTFFDLFPFKEGFFDNNNFTFSYITETVLALITFILWLKMVIHFKKPIKKSIWLYRLQLIYAFLFLYVSIWLNYNISNYLVACIIQSFALLSIISNIVIYIFIDIIAFLIYGIFEIIFLNLYKKNNN